MQQSAIPGTSKPDSAGYLVLAAASRKELRYALPTEELSRLRVGEPVLLPGSLALLVLVTGLGPINAALAMGRLLGQGISIRGVLNLGLAGSFDLDSIGLGQPALVSTEICPEFGLRYQDHVDHQGLGWGQGRLGSRVIRERLELEPASQAAGMGLRLPRHWPLACSLTVLGVTACRDLARKLQRAHQAELENMEGFALAWACLQSGVPFVQARAVSNLVGSRQKQYWDMQSSLRALPSMLQAMLPEQS
ncbi:MAG: futalosine hydrolase [Desulfohalobiaceae bacterium]